MKKQNKAGLFVLIGNPVEHSVSPAMFNAAFRHRKLWQYIYFTLRLEKDELRWFVKAFKKLNFIGANVTIPHKVEITKHLDSLHDSALRAGAVNVIAKRRGKTIGYNTDALAVVKVLENVCKRRGLAIVLGCGGAARAAAVALDTLRFESQVFVGRSTGRIRDMHEFLKSRRINGSVININERSKLNNLLEVCDLVINATPVGMYPHVEETILDSSRIRPGVVVFDMVYNPPETRLLREAKAAGAVTVGGLDMLVKQAEEAYSIWLDCKAPSKIMYEVAAGMLARFNVENISR